MTEEATVSPVVLRNKGAPIRFAKLGDDGAPALDDGGEVVYEKVYVRMNCNIFAEIEETWGGGIKLQEALNTKPATTVRQMLSMCLEIDPDEVGRRIDMPQFDTYHDAISLAYLIASGVDPTEANKRVTEGRKAINEAVAMMMAIDESPGTNGSESGADLVEVSTSSGI